MTFYMFLVMWCPTARFVCCKTNILCQNILWVKKKKKKKKKTGSLSRLESCEEAHKSSYRVWLSCVGRFAESTEWGAAECAQAEILCCLLAFTPACHRVVTPVNPQGFPALGSTMPTGSSGWCPSFLSTDGCSDIMHSRVSRQLRRWGMDIPVWLRSLFWSLLSSLLKEITF